jgi:DNA-binding HxlR family transcriptional regulator
MDHARSLYELGADKSRRRADGARLGLVTVEQDPKNASRRKVFLTDQGRALAAKIIAPARRDEKYALHVPKIEVPELAHLEPSAPRLGDLALDRLKEVGHDGACAQLIRENIERAHGRAVSQTTMSSVLGSLQKDGLARRESFIWFATTTETRAQVHG